MHADSTIMDARHLLLWVQLGVLASPAVPLRAGTLERESLRLMQAAPADEVSARRELVVAAFQWLDATLAGDFAAQSRFYPERMPVFYLWRDVPKSAVMDEKRRVFEQAETIDIKMEAPQLLVDPGARAGRMYFRKTYVIRGEKLNRAGEVLQELRWEKEMDGWKIVSERDLRVLRKYDNDAAVYRARD
jgi:hypothetical protein